MYFAYHLNSIEYKHFKFEYTKSINIVKVAITVDYMNILISSFSFYPNIGGIEEVSSILAKEFIYLGHNVKIVTYTPDNNSNSLPFEIFRQPKASKLLELMQWCDIFFHNNISLKTFWPLLFVRRPWVVAHHTWLKRCDNSQGWQDYIKQFLLKFASSISVSSAIAEHLSTPSDVIGNPYNDQIFFSHSNVKQTNDLVFVGRLVSDKGVDLIIKALGILKAKGLSSHLTIIGEGPEEFYLVNLVTELGLKSEVLFLGRKEGPELAQILRTHKFMVVPSRWHEPFGIVALEAIACGCVVVGSEGGGLKDAIGPCGVTFPNNNLQALTDCLAILLANSDTLYKYKVNACSHLLKHHKTAVAKAYLEVFNSAIK